MNNNLDRMEQSLRSIAKRYKTIKYSIGLAILFLMIGGNAFSQEINGASNTANTIPTTEEINSNKNTLRNSIGNLKEKIKSAREENNKKIKATCSYALKWFEKNKDEYKDLYIG